jgi:hypothetical protein
VAEKLKALVNEANGKKNWSVMFVGASEKSVLEAKSYGVSSGNIAKALFTDQGVYTANAALSNVMHRRAYASSRGVTMNTTTMFSGSTDVGGLLHSTLNFDDIDAIADNTVAPDTTTTTNK